MILPFWGRIIFLFEQYGGYREFAKPCESLVKMEIT